MQEIELYLKYVGKHEEDTSKIDLVLLGESIIGFDWLIKDLIKSLGINGEVVVKARKTRKGSLIFDLIIAIANGMPFVNINDYVEFLKLAGQILPKIDLNEAQKFHNDINALASKCPLDLLAVSFVLKKLFDILKQRKKGKLNFGEKDGLSLKQAQRLNAAMKSRRKTCRKALKPFVEDEVKEIQISEEKNFKNPVVINKDNFSDYLSEDEKILPDWENGMTLNLQGMIVGLLSDRGDYMKIKIYGIDKKIHSLVAFPGEENTTENFTGYYRKNINLDVEVFRFSLYQKPKLIIKSISIAQEILI